MSDKITNELILDEIKKSRQDVKATLQAVEARISLKIEENNLRLNKLEKENKKREELLEKIERKGKENNIVIFGLGHTQSKISLEFICSEIKKLVGVDVIETDLNNFYPLGKEENCPIKIEFVSYLKKALVLKNATKLKGTNISIANDMTIKQREENKLLRRHLQLAKQNKNNQCYLKKNKLFINNQMYTVEELENYEYIEEQSGQIKQTSTAGTPTQEKLTAKELPNKSEKLNPKSYNQQPATTSINTRLKEGKEAKQSKEMENDEKIKTRSNK